MDRALNKNSKVAMNVQIYACKMKSAEAMNAATNIILAI
jgi:hypothetical protein